MSLVRWCREVYKVLPRWCTHEANYQHRWMCYNFMCRCKGVMSSETGMMLSVLLRNAGCLELYVVKKYELLAH